MSIIPPGAESTGLNKHIHIAVVAPSEPAEFFNLMWEGVCSATSELSPLGVQITIFKTEGHDVEAQKRILTGLLDSRYSAIAIVPAHASDLDDLIAQHTERGTRVVTFHADAPGSVRCSYVGPDAKQAGTLAGELLGKLTGGRGKLLSFPGSTGVQNMAGRYQGLLEELSRNAPEVQEICCAGQTGDLEEIAKNLLREHPDAGGIYVGYSQVHKVAAAMQALNLRVPCVGFNNTESVRPYLQGGSVAAVVDENTYQQGYIAVERAYEAVTTVGLTTPSWVRVPSTLVLRSNAADSVSGESLNQAFELVIRQRTARLRSYQERLEDANKKLLLLAETDPLTGLMNRRKFEEIMECEVAARLGLGGLSILMIDLDAFKVYNDSYGHHVGDEALRTVGRILQNCSRKIDFSARLGGDEFCLLLPDSGTGLASEVRDRILEAVRHASIAPQTLNLRIQLSIGIATMPHDGSTAEDLIVAADQAMYAQKRQGRSNHATHNHATGNQANSNQANSNQASACAVI